jgi:hypothetical protein
MAPSKADQHRDAFEVRTGETGATHAPSDAREPGVVRLTCRRASA